MPPPLLQVALNGSRALAEHPAIPRTPHELAVESLAAVRAGGQVLHLHAYDESGSETFHAEPCAAAIRAVRVACPGIPVSLSTSEAIESDPARRLELIADWTELPDLVTANQGESGIVELCEHLMERGVGIEAGLLGVADAETFVRTAITDVCARVMIEPMDEDPDQAVAHAAAMEQVLVDASINLEQVHHGDGIASWAVNKRAVARGHGIRTGLEDTILMPDGQLAPDNAALVRAATTLRAG
nr:3-keto-5-aminohexanoate cleavage protein [Actinomycetota bacterium]